MFKKGVNSIKKKFELIPFLLLLIIILFGFGIIKEFFLKPSITGLTTLNAAGYCDQTKGTGYYDIIGTIDCDSILAANGAIFNAANTELNCQDNTITGGGSAGFGMNITSINSNMNIRNCRITSFTTEGIHLYSANNTLIWNSNISASTNNDIKITKSINITLLNVNYSKINFTTSSNYTRQWYIRTKVNYTNGTNVNGATVIAFNSTSATYTLTTNSSGHAIFNATEYTNDTASGTAYYATYSVNATIGNFRAVNSSILIGSGNKDVILTLTQDNPPNVSNLTYPLNASSITSSPIDFNFTVEDDYLVVNCTLYANFSGSWLANNSRDINYNYSNKTFNITIPSLRDGTYLWNIQCTDNSTIVQTDFYDNNFTFTINTCGGGLCSGTELCSSCSSDCGACPSSGSSSSGGGSSGGSSSGCSSSCNTLNEKKCTYDNEAYDTCLQNPDGCRYWSNRIYCETYQTCSNGECVCKNECSYAYKKCVKDEIEECVYERGCFKKYTRPDEECKQQYLALTQGDCHNHCNNSKQDCFETGVDCGDGCKKCPVEEQPISIPVIPKNILTFSAVIITTGIIFSLWPLLLALLIPFMLLRFKHYYVYLIDLNSLINESSLIKTTEHNFREPITHIHSEEENRNKYIFKKDGFIDVIENKPLTLVAHFIYKKRAKKFAHALKNSLKHSLPETKEKYLLIHSIKVGREHPSIAYKLKHRKI